MKEETTNGQLRHLRNHRYLGGRMDLVRRLIWALWLAAVLTTPAQADTVATVGGWTYLGTTLQYGTAQLAATARGQQFCNGNVTSTACISNCATDVQTWQISTPCGGITTAIRRQVTCPANSTVSGTSCVCNSGYSALNGACVLNNCPDAGHTEGDSSEMVQTSGSMPAGDLCIQGCVARSTSLASAGCMNGKCYANGPFRFSGGLCDPTATASTAPKPVTETPPSDAQCVAQGKCPGTVNGTTVCVTCSTKSQTTVKTAAEAASSVASGVTTATGKGTTTTETTECANGSCTTTTTKQTANSDGTSSEEKSTVTEPMSSFCKDNPEAALCKGEEGGKWGGSCGGFTCDGDAVQCAQAQAAWKLTCGLDTEASDPTVQAGVAAVGAGDRPAGHPGNDAEEVPFQLSSMLDSTPLFGSSADCPVDVNVTAMGKSIVMPFSVMCPYLRMLGAAFMAACYLAAAGIVFKG